MENKVAVLKADYYDKEIIAEKIQTLFSLLGGADSLIKPGQRVLIKPNLIAKARPEEAITTHPSIIEALCHVVISCGAVPVIAESPAGGYTIQSLTAFYEISGIAEAARNCGAELNLDTTFRNVPVHGTIVSEMPVIKPALDCDLIISAAKLKTHALTVYTGAAKNMFGIVPGYHKAQFHAKYLKNTFFDAILDVCEYAKPVISIIDGIWGMEGDGPTAGKSKKAGLLLASKNPYAADLAAATLVGIDYHNVPMMMRSMERGLCPKKLEELCLCGDFETLLPTVFYRIPGESEQNFLKHLPSPLRRYLTKKFTPYPYFTDRCTGCGHCAQICPAKALTILNRKAHLNKENCIKCYCCQETCPIKAVTLGKKGGNTYDSQTKSRRKEDN